MVVTDRLQQLGTGQRGFKRKRFGSALFDFHRPYIYHLTSEDISAIAKAGARQHELTSALQDLVTAIDHMGRERELLDEVHYSRDGARAVLEDRSWGEGVIED